MISLPLADLARLGLIQGINSIYSRATQSSEAAETTITRGHLMEAFDHLRAIGIGDLASRLTGPSAQEIAANRLTSTPQSGSSAENYILENHLRLGCLIYALPRAMDLEQAAQKLCVKLPKDQSPLEIVGACSTGHLSLIAAARLHLVHSFLSKAVEPSEISNYLSSRGLSEEGGWETFSGFKALGAMASSEKVREESRQQTIGTVALSIYGELSDRGFDAKDIIAGATELLGLATETIRKESSEMRTRLHAALDIELDTLSQSVRLSDCLQSANIFWVGQLVQRTENDMLKVKRMTKKPIKELKAILTDLSAKTGVTLSLGMLPEQLHGWRPPRDRI